MSTADPHEFLQGMQRVETLVEEIEHSVDPGLRAASQELVRTVLDLHGAALSKVLGLLSAAGEAGHAILDACAGDELVSNVLLLHGLHPRDLPERVRQALEHVRPSLRAHGGNVQLLEIAGATVRLRLEGNCHGCPSSAATLRSTIEQAIYDAAPDVMAIEVESEAEPAPPSALVQLGLMARDGAIPPAVVENITSV